MIALLGHSPVDAYRAILTTSFKSSFGIVETIHKWVPLVLLALAFTIPLAAGKYNIGGEGQLLVGATASAAIGIVLADLPLVALLPLVLLGGLLAGSFFAWIAAWLMDRFGVNEILSTVLLNFVSFGIVDYVASEVWSDPAAGHPTTIPIGEGGLLPTVGRPPLHLGVVLALIVAVAVIIVMRRTVPGYELRAVGDNPRAAQVHGVRIGRIAVGSLVIGGALAGLAGAIEVAGVHGKLIEGMQSNYLLLGIIIGLIARGNVLVVPFVAFGISVLEVGASAMQRTAGVPSEMVLIVEALILLFLLFSDVVGARLRRSSR
ncbi:MAG TPA: ABC transporter permease [Intrasporangium sp.]|uniref:ABC transporter permease n=1 Tax=Intrasporangium sp. TaxID=1925024 RepID=UPI002B486570|nr:ABC transporter permease [Intrasporangium sp.]HKX65939.1 ABC transporter permease [Intrasporangium sp.]